MRRLLSSPRPGGVAVELLLEEDAAIELRVCSDGRVIDVTALAADLVLDGVGLALADTRDPAGVDPHAAVEIATVALTKGSCQARIMFEGQLPAELIDALGIHDDGMLSWPQLSSLIGLCVSVLFSST